MTPPQAASLHSSLARGGAAHADALVVSSLPTTDRAQLRARIGLSIEQVRTTAAGRVTLAASDTHRIKMHASEPVRGACGTHKFVYQRGQVDIVPPWHSDSWTEDDPGLSLVVHLTSGLLRDAAEDLGLDPSRASLDHKHQFEDAQIEHIVWALEADRSAGSPGGALYADCLGRALAVHLLGRYRAPTHAHRGLAKPQLRRVTDFIEAHLDRDLTLAQLARVANLSGSHFKTLFKASTGVPVHTYVVQRRVEKAKRLLMQGDLSAAQVALESGFAHQSHMARWMRRVLGVVPSAIVRQA